VERKETRVTLASLVHQVTLSHCFRITKTMQKYKQIKVWMPHVLLERTAYPSKAAVGAKAKLI